MYTRRNCVRQDYCKMNNFLSACSDRTYRKQSLVRKCMKDDKIIKGFIARVGKEGKSWEREKEGIQGRQFGQ